MNKETINEIMKIIIDESKGGASDTPPGPISFIFKQFFEKKIGQMIGWSPTLLATAPPPRLGNPGSATDNELNYVNGDFLRPWPN